MVGQVAFLISGPLSEVFIHLDLGKHVLFLTEAEPGDAAEGGQVNDLITQGALDGVDQHAEG